MKRIVIILIGLISVAYGQYSPTSAKSRFVNGIALGTKLDSYFAAADSNAIYWRADSALMAKYKGTARRVVFSGELAPYKLVADTFFTSGYTTRARTKQQIDSLGAAIGSGFVTIGTTQTVTGAKTFSLDLNVNGLTVGRGGSSVGSNTAVGYDALRNNTTGVDNTAVGYDALRNNTTGFSNIAFGEAALRNNTTGDRNTSIGFEAGRENTTGIRNTSLGYNALRNPTTGSYNTAIGVNALYEAVGDFNIALGSDAGQYITGLSPNALSNNSIFIGSSTKALANNQTNQIVIGHSVTGNGSNTVTIGNSSVTGNYFNGFLKQTSVTSSVLKADGSGVVSAAVAGTDYVIPSALSGYVDLTTNQTVGGIKTFTAANDFRNTNTFFGSVKGYIYTVDDQINSYWSENADAKLNINFFGFNGGTTRFRSTEIFDGKGARIALFNGSDKATTLSGALNGTSLSMSGTGYFGDNISLAAGKRLQFSATAYMTPEDNIQGARVKTGGGFVVESASNTFNSVINGTSLSMSGAGSFGTTLGVGGTPNFGKLEVVGGNTNQRLYVGTNAAATNSMDVIGITAAGATIPLGIAGDRISMFYGNGITEGARLASDGTFLINTTTTDGVNKLIVGGKVKIDSLAGTGDRLVQANSSGQLSATQTIASGTYTPTTTGITNITSTTGNTGQYQRIGNIVTVTGRISVTVTSNNTLSQVDINLPIASNFTDNANSSGIAVTQLGSSGSISGIIIAETTNDRVSFSFYPTSGAGSSIAYNYSFTYIVQ